MGVAHTSGVNFETAEHMSCSDLDTDRGGTTPRIPATGEHTSAIWYPLRPGERCVRRCPRLSGWMFQGQMRMITIYLLTSCTSCHPNANPTTLCSQRRAEAWASPELTSLSDHHFAILKARACSCSNLQLQSSVASATSKGCHIPLVTRSYWEVYQIHLVALVNRLHYSYSLLILSDLLYGPRKHLYLQMMSSWTCFYVDNLSLA